MVAYAEDTKGDEIYTVYVMDIETQATIGEPLVGVTSYLEWAGDDALVYVTMDTILRPYKVRSSSFDTIFNCLDLIGTSDSKTRTTTQAFHDFTKSLSWFYFFSNY